jgi:uncharacterized membrane protein YesL
MTWAIIHSILRLALMALSIGAITKYRNMFILLERIGLSMMGGCAFLTIDVIWMREDSPFDGWATSMFTLGGVLFLTGLLYRKNKHQLANERQVRQSRAYLKARGKI